VDKSIRAFFEIKIALDPVIVFARNFTQAMIN